MPCLPGFLPVMNEDHATAVIGGKVVSRSALAPPVIILEMWGRYPFSISASRTLKEAPSSPMTSSLLFIELLEPKGEYTLGEWFVQPCSTGQFFRGKSCGKS